MQNFLYLDCESAIKDDLSWYHDQDIGVQRQKAKTVKIVSSHHCCADSCLPYLGLASLLSAHLRMSQPLPILVSTLMQCPAFWFKINKSPTPVVHQSFGQTTLSVYHASTLVDLCAWNSYYPHGGAQELGGRSRDGLISLSFFVSPPPSTPMCVCTISQIACSANGWSNWGCPPLEREPNNEKRWKFAQQLPQTAEINHCQEWQNGLEAIVPLTWECVRRSCRSQYL